MPTRRIYLSGPGLPIPYAEESGSSGGASTAVVSSGPVERHAPIVGGVLENEEVALTALLYEALTTLAPAERRRLSLRLCDYRNEAFALLMHLTGDEGRAGSLMDDLLAARRVDAEPALVNELYEILQANVDLARAEMLP